MSRLSRARIDLDALRHNYLAARRLHGGRAVAVLKANAYGHGAVECARALESVSDAFGVAFVAEVRSPQGAHIDFGCDGDKVRCGGELECEVGSSLLTAQPPCGCR